jgi:hypothetical protein
MSFPDFDNPAEEPDITDADDAKALIQEAINDLVKNEPNLAKNLKKLNALGEAGLTKLIEDITASSTAATSGPEEGGPVAETE